MYALFLFVTKEVLTLEHQNSGEAKLKRIVTPDVWKDQGESSGSKDGPASSKAPSKSPSKKIKTVKKAAKFNPYERRCKICKGVINEQGAFYCLSCAYKKGM
jgi:hypothetical protein